MHHFGFCFRLCAKLAMALLLLCLCRIPSELHLLFQTATKQLLLSEHDIIFEHETLLSRWKIVQRNVACARMMQGSLQTFHDIRT